MHRSKKPPYVESQYTWRVGEPCPFDQISWVDNVYAVQAEADELAYILRNFMGLPLHHPYPSSGRALIHRWYGDHARFIAGNL